MLRRLGLVGSRAWLAGEYRSLVLLGAVVITVRDPMALQGPTVVMLPSVEPWPVSELGLVVWTTEEGGSPVTVSRPEVSTVTLEVREALGSDVGA